MSSTTLPAPDVLVDIIPHAEAILAALTSGVVHGLYDRSARDGVGSALWVTTVAADELRDAAVKVLTELRRADT